MSCTCRECLAGVPKSYTITEFPPRIPLGPAPRALVRPRCEDCGGLADPRPGNARGDRDRARCLDCQRQAVLRVLGISEGVQEIRITRALRELRRHTSYLVPSFEEP